MNKQQNGVVNASSFAWNTIGSILSAGSSFVLLSCVTQAIGAADGGIFAFAFSSAQLMLTVGKYGVRSYQATDVNKEISASSYFMSRILSCLLMMLLCVGMILVLGYQGASASVILAVGLLKMVDAVEDVYHGQMQLNNKLDTAGKLLALRNLFSMVLFAALIFTTGQLELTCWVTAIVSLLLCVAINHPMLARMERVGFCWNGGELRRLIVACLPLFVGHFLSLYIYNVPKYAIEMYCASEIQTYYNVIFMPAFAINLLSEFVFKPLLTSLALWWDGGEIGRFRKLVFKMIAYIFGLTLVILVGTYVVGTPILSFVFGVDIAPYRTELMLLMFGGGFGAIVYFLYNVLASMRAQGAVLINYGAAAVVITVIAFLTVGQHGILAASLSYVIAEIILGVLMILSVVMGIRRYQRKGETTHEGRNHHLSGNE